LVTEGNALKVDNFLLDVNLWHNRVYNDGDAKGLATADIDDDLGAERLDLSRSEAHLEGKLRVTLDLALQWEDLKLLLGTLHVEDCWSSQLILDVDCAVLGLQTYVDVSEVELLFEEDALGLGNLT